MNKATHPAMLLLLLGFAASGHSASPYAGKSLAAAVCSQCHGIRRPSSDAPFPPLAGRDSAYLKQALKQYRDKTRGSAVMNRIAGSLTDKDINNIASYYSKVKP
jgi:cytochrome c553